MEDDKFEWNYYPERGSSIKWDWVFVASGKHGKCTSCGKSWHVIWENASEFSEDDNEDAPQD